MGSDIQIINLNLRYIQRPFIDLIFMPVVTQAMGSVVSCQAWVKMGSDYDQTWTSLVGFPALSYKVT